MTNIIRTQARTLRVQQTNIVQISAQECRDICFQAKIHRLGLGDASTLKLLPFIHRGSDGFSCKSIIHRKT
jgi:hypothetical protein